MNLTSRPHILLAATVALALAGAAFTAPAQAASYTFSQGGFNGGGTITGSFSGNDIDHDGWLFGFELTAFSLRFSGNADIAAFTHTKANLGGIGYFIGDSVIGGRDGNYLRTSSSSGGRFINYDAFGWPEFTIPGRITLDPGAKLLMSNELIHVSAVPEPAAWAMLLGGLGAMGFVARRRRPS